MGALKSKTVWAGVLMAAWGGAVLPFLNAGDFSREAIVSLVFGVVTIALRFVTNKPLSEK